MSLLRTRGGSLGPPRWGLHDITRGGPSLGWPPHLPTGTLIDMPFVTPLRIEEMPGGRTFRVLEDLVYRGSRDTFTVAAGFVFDFASIPRLVTWLVPKLGKYNKAAAVHDWLYVTQPVTRKDADGIFLRIMREESVAWWRRHLMHFAVRIGGWLYWNRNRKRLERAG